MVADPADTAVTVTDTLVAFAGNATEAGTVAAEVLSELSAIVRPAGAGAERFKVSVPVPPAPTVNVFG